MNPDAPHIIPDADGIYPGVLDLHYHAWSAVSQSGLKVLERSPAHYRVHMADPPEPTRAMEVGSAVHLAALRPDEFDRWFVLRPPGRANSNAYKDAVARIRRDNPWRRVLWPDDYDTAMRVRDAVHAHADARVLLAGAATELSVVWSEPETMARTPVRCKARLDMHNPDLGAVGDLKTCMDARPEPFGRQIDTLRYYRQASWYLRGAAAAGITDVSWVFVAVEKVPPYAVWCHELGDPWLSLGEDELEPLLDRYVACESSGQWPAYPPGIRAVYPTQWQEDAARRRSRELLELTEETQ